MPIIRGAAVAAQPLNPTLMHAMRRFGYADMFTHILIPVDGSAVSMAAARAGVAFAKDAGAKVTAYLAVSPIPYGFYAHGAPADDPMKVELEQRARAAGEKHVQAVAQAAESAGVNCDAVVEVAIPDEGIVATARKRKCDAIFIASHGLSGIKRLLLGSVTSRVLASADVPVIVYR